MPSAMQGKHGIANRRDPIKCLCGEDFTRFGSLQRHIDGKQKWSLPEYECTEQDCYTYRGKNGFMRKDKLEQHLRTYHKLTRDEIELRLPCLSTVTSKQPACHVPTCEYYRGPEFKYLPVLLQVANRPFDKQSDYTQHMKLEHDWSPHPCKIEGCGRIRGKGFFSLTAFKAHYGKEHPGSTMPAQFQDGGATGPTRCDRCQQEFDHGIIKEHKAKHCRGRVPCGYCDELIEVWQLEAHRQSKCKGKVKCPDCAETVKPGILQYHGRYGCRGIYVCPYCHESILVRRQQHHKQYECTKKVKCPDCSKMVVPNQLGKHQSSLGDCMATEAVCHYCNKLLDERYPEDHLLFSCTAEVACDYCDERIQRCEVYDHANRECTGKITCQYCDEQVLQREFNRHEESNCKGKVRCRYCQESVLPKSLLSHQSTYCTGQTPCRCCNKRIQRRERRLHESRCHRGRAE